VRETKRSIVCSRSCEKKATSVTWTNLRNKWRGTQEKEKTQHQRRKAFSKHKTPYMCTDSSTMLRNHRTNAVQNGHNNHCATNRARLGSMAVMGLLLVVVAGTTGVAGKAGSTAQARQRPSRSVFAAGGGQRASGSSVDPHKKRWPSSSLSPTQEYSCVFGVVGVSSLSPRGGGEADPYPDVAVPHVPVPAAERGSGSDEAGAPVGVKEHPGDSGAGSGGNQKLSNAVGDPDGEGSSDDDDDIDVDDLSDWDTSNEFIDVGDDGCDEAIDSVMEQVQVDVEYVEDENSSNRGDAEEDDDDEDDDEVKEVSVSKRRSGGVGVRLGQRFRNNSKSKAENNCSSSSSNSRSSQVEQDLLQAWQSHVYLPPANLQYLRDNARQLDGESKVRLDRRTLYAGLLLEWSSSMSLSSSSSSSDRKSNRRKFLEADTSQSLQAALSLATQPSWRKSFPRASAIRLYGDEDEAEGGGRRVCTLAMQETIVMALVRVFSARCLTCLFWLQRFTDGKGFLTRSLSP
jgi:hypothetical protein